MKGVIPLCTQHLPRRFTDHLVESQANSDPPELSTIHKFPIFAPRPEQTRALWAPIVEAESAQWLADITLRREASATEESKNHTAGLSRHGLGTACLPILFERAIHRLHPFAAMKFTEIPDQLSVPPLDFGLGPTATAATRPRLPRSHVSEANYIFAET